MKRVKQWIANYYLVPLWLSGLLLVFPGLPLWAAISFYTVSFILIGVVGENLKFEIYKENAELDYYALREKVEEEVLEEVFNEIDGDDDEEM